MDTPRREDLGPGYHRELKCRRMVSLFTPNDDGSDSTTGDIEWHTEWWYYLNGSRVGGTIVGPILTRSFADLLHEIIGSVVAYEDEGSATVSGLELLLLNKELFERVADEDLAPRDAHGSPMAPMGVP